MKHVSTSCLTASCSLTLATRPKTERRKPSTSAESCAKFSKWLLKVETPTTRTTTPTSESALRATSSKTSSESRPANSLETSSTNLSATTTESGNSKSHRVFDLTSSPAKSCTPWPQETGSVAAPVSANCLTAPPTLQPFLTCGVSPPRLCEASLTSKHEICTRPNGADSARTKLPKVKTAVS